MLVWSTFGGTWEAPGGGSFKFAVKRDLKQDQTVHMEWKLQFILYFSRECGLFYIGKYVFDLTSNKIFFVEMYFFVS